MRKKPMQAQSALPLRYDAQQIVEARGERRERLDDVMDLAVSRRLAFGVWNMMYAVELRSVATMHGKKCVRDKRCRDACRDG